MRTNSPKDKDEYSLVQSTLGQLAKKLDAEVYWSLSDWKYAGSACMIKKPFVPNRVEYTIPQLATVEGHFDPLLPSHHPDGRIVRLHYDPFQILQTYSPNNGTTKASFQRRELWDAALLEFCKTEEKLIWVGDLNVAPTTSDVSHPSWFAQQFLKNPADYCGHPGFTLAERRRFATLLEEGDMVDTFRHFHPRETSPPIESDEYSWRGSPPINVPFSNHYGKGMRVDHAIVKRSLMPRVHGVTLCGHGKERIGFLGSDHCPLMIRLKCDNGSKASSEVLD